MEPNTKLGFPTYFGPELQLQVQQEKSSKSRPAHVGTGLLRRMRAGPYNYSAVNIWGAHLMKDGGFLVRNYLGYGVALVSQDALTCQVHTWWRDH